MPLRRLSEAVAQATETGEEQQCDIQIDALTPALPLEKVVHDLASRGFEVKVVASAASLAELGLSPDRPLDAARVYVGPAEIGCLRFKVRPAAE